MEKKKNDHEASLPGAKKGEKEVKPRIRVSLFLAPVARLLYDNWQPCEGWNDVHLFSGGVSALHGFPVPVLPVPRAVPRGSERSNTQTPFSRRTFAAIPTSPSTHPCGIRTTTSMECSMIGGRRCSSATRTTTFSRRRHARAGCFSIHRHLHHHLHRRPKKSGTMWHPRDQG
jgi:hypothetical protein